MWARFVERQDLAAVLRCHIAAFEALGGVPAEILYDRMKTAVLGEVDERGIVYNTKLLDLAVHYGFVPKACKAYRAKTKGKVERPFRYVREDFFLGRSFRSLEDLNAQFRQWPACCMDAGECRRRAVHFNPPDLPVMPHKYNADRRHHIVRSKRRVTNWSEYNEALRQRGSLTVWFTDEAIAAWKAAPRTTPGGQPHYSDLAITTALTLRAVFHLPLRQTEGLIGSVLQLLGLDLPVPDYSTLSRRAQTLELPAQPRATGGAIHLLVDSSGLKLGGPGEWLVEKHGTSRRRSWRKLHNPDKGFSGC